MHRERAARPGLVPLASGAESRRFKVQPVSKPHSLRLRNLQSGALPRSTPLFPHCTPRRTSGTRGCAPGGRARRWGEWSCASRASQRPGTRVGHRGSRGGGRARVCPPHHTGSSLLCAKGVGQGVEEGRLHDTDQPLCACTQPRPPAIWPALPARSQHLLSCSWSVPSPVTPPLPGSAVPPTPDNQIGYVALFGYRGSQARTMAITKNEGITGVTGGLPPLPAARLFWCIQSGRGRGACMECPAAVGLPLPSGCLYPAVCRAPGPPSNLSSLHLLRPALPFGGPLCRP